MLAVVSVTIALTYLSTLYPGVCLGCKQPLWGATCTYKCNCRNGTCALDGTCAPPGDCFPDWFGPSCQYADLASILNGSGPSWATDGSLDSCSPANDQKADLSISMSMAFTFTWLKLFVTSSVQDKLNAGTLPVPELYFDNKKDQKCKNQTVYADGDGFIVECDLTSLVQSVSIVGGELTANLCEVKVYGGINVALNRPTNQTGDKTENGRVLSSYKGVDGLGYDGNVENCAYDDPSSVKHKWSLFLDTPAVLHSIRIINRNDCIHRLNGFAVELFGAGPSSIYAYKLPSTVVNRTQYSVTFPLTDVETHWLTVESFFDAVTICELEAFADIDCSSGKWGLNSQNNCQCTNNTCFCGTGACIYEAKKLPTVCPVGTYGEQCDKKCDHCGSEGCDVVTGNCKSCPAGGYGSKCESKCSENCLNKICDMVKGDCLACVDDYSGDKCETSSTQKDDNLLPMIVTGCLVLVTVPFIIIFCFLRRSKKPLSKAEE